MKLKFRKQAMNPRELIRRCGYGEGRNPRDGVFSYTRRLGGNPYPHFHVYIDELPDAFVFNIHLDQKKPSYGGSSAHNGEYDGELVRAEARRLIESVGGYIK
ncbi:MAG: hypothetical protein V1763_02695 [Parcubacteria group bacterium]